MPEKKKKTTMSVTEMRKMLGLGKTDSYWLVHKNCFETIIGTMKLSDVTPRVLEKYYMSLLQTKAVIRCTDKQYTKRETPGKRDSFVTPGTVRRVHKLLNSAFTQAMKWELIEKNPAQLATVPKAEKKTRAIWDADTLFHAIEVCEDERLKMAINLSFSCSLRIGELLGLTWDCVDVSEESLTEGKASIFVNKELQRVRKSTMKTLEKKDILCVFPEQVSDSTTVLVLKKPKTLTSTRRVYLPKTVAEMLIDWKKDQDLAKEELGDEYHDYQLVLAGPFGTPMESSRISTLIFWMKTVRTTRRSLKMSSIRKRHPDRLLRSRPVSLPASIRSF